MSEDTKPSPKARPLSPHLQVYSPQMTSVLSILHRLTGVTLALGLFILIWALFALATGVEAYAQFLQVANSVWGKLVLTGISAAFCYHLSNGVRHLIWDTGNLFKIEEAYKAGIVVLCSAIALTALLALKIWGVV